MLPTGGNAGSPENSGLKNDSAALPYQSAPQPASDEVPDAALGDGRHLQVLRVEVRVRRRYADDRDADLRQVLLDRLEGLAAALGRVAVQDLQRQRSGSRPRRAAAWPWPGRTGTGRVLLEPTMSVGQDVGQRRVDRRAAEHLEDVVAVDRVATAPAAPSASASALLLFGETVLKTTYGLLRRGRRRGSGCGSFFAISAGQLRRRRRTSSNSMSALGVPVCSCCWIESWLTVSLITILSTYALRIGSVAGVPGRVAGEGDRLRRRRTSRPCTGRRRSCAAPSSVLAGQVGVALLRGRREGRQGQHVDEVAWPAG